MQGSQQREQASETVPYEPVPVAPGAYWSAVYKGLAPSQYNEAPMLAALVAQGKLPAVEERLPIMEDVYIIAPPDEIGSLWWHHAIDGALQSRLGGPG